MSFKRMIFEFFCGSYYGKEEEFDETVNEVLVYGSLLTLAAVAAAFFIHWIFG